MEAHLRVHTSFVSQDTLVSWVRDRADSWFVALEEDATRPHFQAYVKFKPKYENMNSLRNALKKILTGQGNGAYSLRDLKKAPEHLICYLFKENKCISKSIPKDLLQAAQDLEVEIQVKMAKKADKHRPIIDQILEQFPPRGRAYSQEEMVSTIVRWFHQEGRMQPDIFMLGKYIRTLCASMDIERYVRVAQREFRDKFSEVQILHCPESFSQDEDFSRAV